jgi:iron(III) transport system substrate-binding protein
MKRCPHHGLTKLAAAVFLACVSLSSYAMAQTPDREAQWNELIAAAKKEGKVVLLGPPDPQVRQELPAAFKARYGITVEYLGTRSTESSAKLRAERSAGVYTVDVVFAGGDTMSGVYYAEKMLTPLRPELISPEATDASKWIRGGWWFMDPEQKYVLRLFNTVGPAFHINTSYVKPEELTSAQELLNPKWKGKISAHDPTVGGSGIGHATRYYLQFGEEFLKKLYVDQKPVIARDRRQLTDWVGRGNYPISLDAEDDEVKRMQKDGLPVTAIYKLSDLPGTLSTGVGQMGLLDHAPHPNAAKLFANWMASKEGLTIYARERGEAPTRIDIDASQWLPKEMIPEVGVDYFDMHDWNLAVTARQKVRLIMLELLKNRRND